MYLPPLCFDAIPEAAGYSRISVERRERDAVYLTFNAPHISAQLIFMRSTLSKCVSCTHSLIAELEQARTYPAQKPARTAPPVLRLLPSPLQCRQP